MSARLEAAGLSDVGRVRTNNEDALLVSPQSGLFAVADGMGGHQHGEWAAAKIIEHLQGTPDNPDFDQRLDEIAAAVHAANTAVRDAATISGETMGSTLAALYVADDRFAVFWIGDSRVYLLRRRELVQLTRDHTHVNDMVVKGLLDADEAQDHPMKNALSRAVGVQDAVELDAICDESFPGDVFLVCSDGLTGFVTAREIAALMALEPPAICAKSLVDLALARGGQDNVTVIVVACEQATLLDLSGPIGPNDE